MRYFFGLVFIVFTLKLQAQVASNYTISFENAVQHEAQVKAEYSNLKSDTVTLSMSRSSPGRYALHEFAKNVYDVKVTNANGDTLTTTRPNPYSWQVTGHNGSINLSYTVFANHGDGTYAQVDETHAHLNMPVVFMYVPELSNQEIEVTFEPREDLNWKIATQLKQQQGNRYYARDLQYFFDSPTILANYKKRSFKVGDQNINLVLHDEEASEAQVDSYFEDLKKIVLEQRKVFGELPAYDYGEYTFLACYMPNATGDGMEHRNSTIVTSTTSLANGGIKDNIGTVAHEFFHCWNVERLRPQSLEPFDFSRANMSGELWFAEGFTSYYDDLSMVRSGVITPEAYIQGLVGTFNYVWTSPGRQFFNPIEMSYQAPFVDAAKSVDETNRENTFISYYSYGSSLGLALDLSLRAEGLNLDDYMKRMWQDFGKTNTFYTIEDLHQTLNTYAGTDFGDAFFSNSIYKSGMPDYEALLKQVGVVLETKDEIGFGAYVRDQVILSNPKMGTSAYSSGFQKGDTLLQLDAIRLDGSVSLNSVLSTFKVGDVIAIRYKRFGKEKKTNLTVQTERTYALSLIPSTDKAFTKKMEQGRGAWLKQSE
ncbi:M61 family metallopeptidase [Subsaximicrobium wynnwilliamsii]|uniref:M61 family metallopeptidase n=2 Tax=Subsaximicrobium wynnwilliamsii TaxID=291179 RepID=A0A5C6ZG32_9FLAO|nr:M61 family metallopeptidase [Subsaximicrobium wynnwilliamsii]TXD88237.1 M61 family metallopeptidase [Subsaximicrobium wynnwilliamsii]TXE02252.1 M61 family metallopeptidase [Subsaximicrobium wynnwilliamsii]